MFQNITNCFDRQGWKYTVIEGQTIVVLGITGKNAKLRCIAQLEADKFQFVFLSSYEQKVPEDKRLLVAELLTRLNFNIFLGNLELDWVDGELRFKTSMNYESVELTEKVIENLVMTNIMTMDSCLTGIIEVIDGTLTPESAVQLIQQSEFSGCGKASPE